MVEGRVVRARAELRSLHDHLGMVVLNKESFAEIVSLVYGYQYGLGYYFLGGFHDWLADRLTDRDYACLDVSTLIKYEVVGEGNIVRNPSRDLEVQFIDRLFELLDEYLDSIGVPSGSEG